MGSWGIVHGQLASFVEAAVKSTDGSQNALASMSVDGTDLHAQLSRYPKDGSFSGDANPDGKHTQTLQLREVQLLKNCEIRRERLFHGLPQLMQR